MSARDPWAFQRWAYATRTGSSERKSVLAALATMADKTTGRCEALQATLSQQTEMGERTVRRHLAELEQAGIIAKRHQYRRNGRRRGDEFLLLAPWIQEWPDGQELPARLAGSGGGTTGQLEHDLPASDDTDYRPERPEVKVNGPLKNDHLGTTPLGPPKGGQPDSQEDLGEATQLWEQVVESIESQHGPQLMLRELRPVQHEGTTITVDGRTSSWCRDRFAAVVAASAADRGVVIDFAAHQAAAGDRRRRTRPPRRRAA